MSNDIYFTTTSGKLVTNHDIAKAAIINGDIVDEYDLDNVRKYASTCKGIVKEIIDWIFKNKYAKKIGQRQSGFCTYPLVEFSKAFMEMIVINEEDLEESEENE